MQTVFFDGPARPHLLPFTFTRPVARMRVGIQCIDEKWATYFPEPAAYLTEQYLQAKFPAPKAGDALYIYGALCPNDALLEALDKLQQGQGLYRGETLLAYRAKAAAEASDLERVEFSGECTLIDRPWKIFSENGAQIEADFQRLTKGRTSASLSSTNTLIGDRIFAEEGVEVEAAVLNSKSGPIYLGAHSSIMEGSVVRGALALGEHSQLKLATKIYGPTTVGPHSKVGGEVNNSVIFGYSNKGHDGFLGNSVLGEWCNLGADTNNSNLKNNYEEVKIWSYPEKRFVRTGLQFCGLMMGDHSKCGINTMFNTGTVVGVSSNIFGSGFPRNFVPSFSWGGAGGFTDYRIDKALQTAKLVMARRGLELNAVEQSILEHIYEETRADN